MDTFGKRLRWARERRVWQQSDLSERSGVAEVTISRLENDYGGRPRVSTIRKLAKVLGVAPEWLVFGDEAVEEDSEGNQIAA